MSSKELVPTTTTVITQSISNVTASEDNDENIVNVDGGGGRGCGSASGFRINENIDILVEVLKRLDGSSLGVATCVCRLWRQLAMSEDSIWEHVCFRHASPPGVRALVVSLGGYKRLYRVCVRPVLGRVGRKRARDDRARRAWARRQGAAAQLLLSLFCVDYYERLGGGSDTTSSSSSSSSSSLLFLCKPVNV